MHRLASILVATAALFAGASSAIAQSTTTPMVVSPVPRPTFYTDYYRVPYYREAPSRDEVVRILTQAGYQNPTGLSLDNEVWKRTEPSTAHPRQRLKAVTALVEAGVKTSVGMAPILPGISDRPEQLREVVRAAREAGATGIWANLLFLRPGTREHFLEHLAEDWPEQLPLYERLYAQRRAYLGAEERNPLREQIGELAREYGIRDRRKVKLAPPPQPEQLSLGF